MKQKKNNNKKHAGKSAFIEPLSPRVLYSVDIFGLGGDIGLSDETDMELALALDNSQEQQPKQTEVVFVDTTVSDYQQVIDSLTASSDQNTEYVVYELSTTQSISDVDQALSAHTNLAAIHFITHGSDANFRLGSSIVNTQTLPQYADNLSQWGAALAEHGDILFYGCNLAETAEGRQLVTDIANATNADVGASDDRTGHASQDADWQLEFAVGAIDIDPSKIAEVLNDWDAVLMPILVDTPLDKVDALNLSSVQALIDAPGDDGFISLREAVIAANADPDADVIQLLPSETYTLDSQDPRNGDYIGDLNVNQSVSIIGGTGTTIDGNDSSRILSFNNAGTSLLSSVTLTNGNTSNGGGAGIEGTAGGGVFSKDTNLSIELVNFNNNEAEIGGALYQNGGIINLTETTIELNKVTNLGGGLFLENGIANLTDVTIKNNDAPNQGGGLYLQANTTNLNDVTIRENKAINNQGGGIFFNGGEINLNDSHLIENSAGVEGGGLYINFGTANVTSTDFSQNFTTHATEFGKGGGAFLNSGLLTVTDSTFEQNVSDDGGALFNRGTVQATDTSFIQNRTDTVTRDDSRGGAVYSAGTFTLDRGLFESNEADNGGGLFNEAFSTTIRDSTFADNQADNGGAIQANGGFTNIIRSTIADNRADNSGSAIDVQAGDVELQGSIVTRNNNPSHDDIHPNVVSKGFNLTSTSLDSAIGSDRHVSAGQIDLDGSLTPVKPGSDLKVFKLNSNSIAINSGALIGTANSQPLTDATGLSRNSALDIGAYEYRQATSDVILYWGDNFEDNIHRFIVETKQHESCLLYTSPSPRDS